MTEKYHGFDIWVEPGEAAHRIAISKGNFFDVFYLVARYPLAAALESAREHIREIERNAARLEQHGQKIGLTSL